MTEWEQERPQWCPHPGCQFRRRSQDALCGGELPQPEPHDGDQNTHRICLNAGEPVFDLQVNATDLDWLRWICDALDGKRTSWLSRRGESPPASEPFGNIIWQPEWRGSPDPVQGDPLLAAAGHPAALSPETVDRIARIVGDAIDDCVNADTPETEARAKRRVIDFIVARLSGREPA